MKVTNFIVRKTRKATRVSADFTFDKPFDRKKHKLSFSIYKLTHAISKVHKVWFEFPSEFEFPSFEDSFFILALPMALALNEDLRFGGNVSEEIMGKVSKMKKYYGFVNNNIKIFTKHNDKKRSKRKQTSQFFTLGVDSFYTLLCHKPRSRYLIFVEGYDIPLSKKEFLGTVRRRIVHVASKTDTQPVFIRTNLRWLSDKIISWHTYHVAALIGAGMMLPVKKIYINGEGFNWSEWGLRSGVDKLFSTGNISFELAAHNMSRDIKIEKLRKSSLFSLFLDNVRVCWQNAYLRHIEYNCSECQKCLKTQLSLLVIGIDKPPTFKGINMKELEKVRMGPGIRKEWESLYFFLKKKTGIDPNILTAINTILKKPYVSHKR